MIKVFRYEDGVLWIGYVDDNFLCGNKLIAVLCGGNKTESFACIKPNKFEEVNDFWDRYIKDGRCAIDANHEMSFIGDEKRWDTTDDVRKCLWCGNFTQKKIVYFCQYEKTEEKWENIRK